MSIRDPQNEFSRIPWIGFFLVITVVHKNITYLKNRLAIVCLTGLHLQLHDKFSGEMVFACASVSRGKKKKKRINYSYVHK